MLLCVCMVLSYMSLCTRIRTHTHNTYMHIHVHVYNMYIYIYRERERYEHIFIHAHTYTSVCICYMCICIYMRTDVEVLGFVFFLLELCHGARNSCGTLRATLSTKFHGAARCRVMVQKPLGQFLPAPVCFEQPTMHKQSLHRLRSPQDFGSWSLLKAVLCVYVYIYTHMCRRSKPLNKLV